MISIPRFGEGSSLHAITKFSSPSEALQEFSQDCLQYQYPDLYVFQTLGRDGGIDGIQNNTWVECKLCSEDKTSSVIQTWKKTEDLLKEQLSKGKNNCQKQYKPWFTSKLYIKEYILFTNASLPNENAVKEVKEYISRAFYEISQLHSNLKHLANVKIEIWHWRRIKALLQQKTNLLFRWFWESWPPGMIPLNIEKEGGFRLYLQSSKLPYYSLETFEKISKTKSPIKNENEILDSFSNSEKIGKIIVGQAGVGKTRIALQVGNLAYERGWIVFRVNSFAPLSSINHLFENLRESDKVLLIIDYVELMDHFKGFVEEINNYNKKYGKKVFYIATSRLSYYYRILFEEYTHEPIVITTDSLDNWTSRYMQEVVCHILKSSKIPNFEEYIPICRGIPVLAVLISYLYEKKKSIDITDILKAKDFGVWLSKHLKLTLPFTENSLVAQFMLCLPISEKTLDKMPLDLEEIKIKLSEDGWIESPSEDKKKRYAIHDVVSDRVVISYCYTIRTEIYSFIKKTLEFARKYECLSSTLVAFERIVDNELFSNIQWDSLIINEMTIYPKEWMAYRIKLLITSLLSDSQKIMLLSENFEYWKDLFSEPLFHQAIGWLIGWLHMQENQKSQRIQSLKNIMKPFIKSTLNYIQNDYLICRALELFPEEFCQIACEKIKKKDSEENKSFILSAYIRSRHKNIELEKELNQWFEIYSSDFVAYHVLQAIFKVGRISGLEIKWFKSWLSTNINSQKAKKLIKLYIENGGKFYYLKDFFLENIKNQKDDSIKCHWIVHWVDHANEFESIEPYMLDITHDKNPEEFNFIYKILPSKKIKLSKNLIKNCLIWCNQNKDNQFGLWTLKRIIWNNFDNELTKDYISTLENLLKNFNFKKLTSEDSSTLNCILYKLLQKTKYKDRLYLKILKCFKSCLQNNHSFSKDIKVYEAIQDKTFFFALGNMLKNKVLKIVEDYEKIRNYMDWFKRWTNKNKIKIKKELSWLDKNYPANLWNIT